jgi:hypothetical protein
MNSIDDVIALHETFKTNLINKYKFEGHPPLEARVIVLEQIVLGLLTILKKGANDGK